MFIPLHVKSDYSLGYGTASIEELVQQASAMGYPALALTDLENLYGQVRFHHHCRLAGIRPITGIELRGGFDARHEVGNRVGRVVLLAENMQGYRSLCRIVSRRRAATAGKPLGDPLPQVMAHAEGVIALSDDGQVLRRLIQEGGFPRRNLAFLVVRPSAKDQGPGLGAAASLGVPPVADLDMVFLERSDHPLHQLQLAIRQARSLRQAARSAEVEDRERWLRPPGAVAALYADLGSAVSATGDIAERCRLDLDRLGPDEAGDLADQGWAPLELRSRCQAALARIYGSTASPHRERLETELAAIDALGFSAFMLVVADILGYCRDQGIPAAVRGSGVSSLTLHLLGGSPVDPLAQGLLFERFLHLGKSSWPDVDIDLPWHRRDEVIDFVYRKFGAEHVAMVAAHHCFRYRSALREGLKAWGAGPALIETLSRALPPEELAPEEVDFLGIAASLPESALREEPPFLPLELGAQLKEVLPLIRRLVGKPHHIAVHPGGIVVDRRHLEDLLPLERAPKGVVITQYDLVAVARLGLVKIDLLGNRCLSELEETLRLAAVPGELTLEEIPAEDPPTLALIDRADTIGCFQLESPAMRSLLMRLPIRHLSDLTAILALIRPGAASGEVKSAFIRRARGEEPDRPVFPLLADRTCETHGLILYEEDIMLLLSRSGGITLAEADELRRGIVKSGADPTALAALRAQFLEKVRRWHPKAAALAQAQRAWATAGRFAAYSFNKAHAASYARLAYFSAYCKVHYPLQFGCALLNHHQGMYPLRVEVSELLRMQLTLHAPSVNESGYHSHCEAGAAQSIRVGLDKVKGLSAGSCSRLLKERTAGGSFATLRDLLERVGLSGREIRALILCGACDGLPPLSAADYPFAHEAAVERLREGCAPHELDALAVPRPAPDEDPGRVQLYQGLTRVRNELRYLEMHLRAHPMALLRPQAQHSDCLPLVQARNQPGETRLRVAAVVAAMRRVPMSRGILQFLTLEDETGILEAVVLPQAYNRLGERVLTPGPFLVEGTLRQQQGAVHLEVEELSPFHQRERQFGS